MSAALWCHKGRTWSPNVASQQNGPSEWKLTIAGVLLPSITCAGHRGCLEGLVLGLAELPLPNIVYAGKSTTLSGPPGISVHLPFAVAEQDTHNFSFHGSFVPVPVITRIALLNGPNGVAEGSLSPAVLLAAIVLWLAQAVSTTPLLVFSVLTLVVGGKKVLVISFQDIKGDQQNIPPVIGDLLRIEVLRYLAACGKNFTSTARFLCFKTSKLFHSLFPPINLNLFINILPEL